MNPDSELVHCGQCQSTRLVVVRHTTQWHPVVHKIAGTVIVSDTGYYPKTHTAITDDWFAARVMCLNCDWASEPGEWPWEDWDLGRYPELADTVIWGGRAPEAVPAEGDGCRNA